VASPPPRRSTRRTPASPPTAASPSVAPPPTAASRRTVASRRSVASQPTASRRSVAPRRTVDARDVAESILDATERLLAERRFDELAVADILAAARVSRASFYFYFESKHAVLAELVRRAVSAGHQAAGAWVEAADASPQTSGRRASPRSSLRRGTEAGARLWRHKAPVLRAIVENWRTDPALTALWTELMEGFTQAAVERIELDRQAGLVPRTTLDTRVLASALTWLGERLYYLAAIGVAPFDDEQHLVDALTAIWAATIYGPSANLDGPSRPPSP
jgi:TetR/AcrR family transcriptional regulator, ethionamide resistance regulator